MIAKRRTPSFKIHAGFVNLLGTAHTLKIHYHKSPHTAIGLENNG